MKSFVELLRKALEEEKTSHKEQHSPRLCRGQAGNRPNEKQKATEPGIRAN